MPSNKKKQPVTELDSYHRLKNNDARLLFLELCDIVDAFGLTCASDDYLQRKSASVSAASSLHITRLLYVLEQAALLAIYRYGGERYLLVSHLAANNPRASKSRWPMPPTTPRFAAAYSANRTLYCVRRYQHKHHDFEAWGVAEQHAKNSDFVALSCPHASKLLEQCWADFKAQVISKPMALSSAARRVRQLTQHCETPARCLNRYDGLDSAQLNQRLTEMLQTTSADINNIAPSNANNAFLRGSEDGNKQNQPLSEMLRATVGGCLQHKHPTEAIEHKQNQPLSEMLPTTSTGISHQQLYAQAVTHKQNQPLSEMLSATVGGCMQHQAEPTITPSDIKNIVANQRLSVVIHRNDDQAAQNDEAQDKAAQPFLRARVLNARTHASASALIDPNTNNSSNAATLNDLCETEELNFSGQSTDLFFGINFGGREFEGGNISQAPAAVVPIETKTPVPAKRAASTGKRLAEDWQLPREWADWVVERYPMVSAQEVFAVAEDFADYWHAKSGANACKMSWSKTWYRWARVHWGNAALRHGAIGPAAQSARPATYRQIDTQDKRAAMNAWMGVFALSDDSQNHSQFEAIPPSSDECND